MLEVSSVIKRSGKTEPFMEEKVNQVVEWAADGIKDISVSELLMKAAPQLMDKASTVEIHQALIKASEDLVSVYRPGYSKLGARLLMFDMRKEVFGTFEPKDFYSHVINMIAIGKYDREIIDKYTKDEIINFGNYINHDLDLEYMYPAVVQWKEKYLIQDRTSGKLFESPQQAIMLIGMCLFQGEDRSHRSDRVKKFYDAVSIGKLSLPTPIMAGVRTPTRQFSSCCLIESGDSLPSINATANAIVSYISQRAGIGINGGAIRALGSSIRGGEAVHTGVIPFYKHFQTAVKSCSQGGVRGGAATLFYPMWHLEVENLLVLKNNRGVEENRIRHMDYGVQLNRLMYKRLQENGNITLFSPDVADGKLYEYFFVSNDLFEDLYLKLESDPTVNKKSVPAISLFGSFISERQQTGRIYIQNVDHCNQNGPFDPSVAPIRQSNLCLEIALPTQPMGTPEEEIALCTLSAWNMSKVSTLEEMEELADISVRALDNLLDYQSYPVEAAKKNLERRTLGFGVIDFAHFLAMNGFDYSSDAGNNLVHEWFEKFQYSLLKASNKLAKERGACDKFNETRYAQGLMPIDRYKKDVDLLSEQDYVCDWESLRKDIAKYGLRNSTLSALMPSETSSQISNATNGIEPPRGLVTLKKSKAGVYKQVVPEIDKLRYKYQLAFDMPNSEGYLKKVGIMQKFVDQAISANTYYNPFHYENNKVTFNSVMFDVLTAYKYGVKTLYYANTKDGRDENENDDFVIEEEDESCSSGACKI